MIELSKPFQEALDSQAEPIVAIDPRTQEKYVLLRADAYQKMRNVVDGFTQSAGWDDPRLDVYEEYRTAEIAARRAERI